MYKNKTKNNVMRQKFTVEKIRPKNIKSSIFITFLTAVAINGNTLKGSTFQKPHQLTANVLGQMR